LVGLQGNRVNKACGNQATLDRGEKCLPGTAGRVEIKQNYTTKITKKPKNRPSAIGTIFIRIFVNFVSLWCILRSFDRFSVE
jgi:hypothetical protein